MMNKDHTGHDLHSHNLKRNASKAAIAEAISNDRFNIAKFRPHNEKVKERNLSYIFEGIRAYYALCDAVNRFFKKKQ